LETPGTTKITQLEIRVEEKELLYQDLEEDEEKELLEDEFRRL